MVLRNAYIFVQSLKLIISQVFMKEILIFYSKQFPYCKIEENTNKKNLIEKAIKI